MRKRITALFLCLSMLLSMLVGSVVAEDGIYDANVGRYAVLADTGYGVQAGNFTDIATGNDMYFAYEEFEPGTIFQITDWYLDSETQSLWYEVDIYAGGLIPESQEYWPAMPWVLQDYVGEDAMGDSLVFLDGCDICGKPDCGGHESVGDITKVFVGGVEAEQLTMPQFDKPTLSAATTLTGKVTYQWQILADRETDLWVDIRGEDQPDLTVTYGMVASLLDDDYRAQVRCITRSGDVRSVSETLTITLEPNVAPVAPDTEDLAKTAKRRLAYSAPTPRAGEEPGEGSTKTYRVTIRYLFQDGSIAASTDSITVGATGVMQNSIQYPAVEGYLPYIINAEGEHERQDEFAARTITEDIELTVYYLPTDVPYRIVVFLQNVENDGYTRLPETITRYALTGSLVPDFTQEQPDGVKLEYEGFYPLLHEMPPVAADGSTEVEMHFDRYYYLMTFDLGGGYGVEPIYARYGTPITVNAPTKAGYSFIGWQRNNANATIPDTMPAERREYIARWRAGTTSYTVVYWTENADDNDYSYWGSRTVQNVAPDTPVSATQHSAVTGLNLSKTAYFTYDANKTAMDEATRDDLNAEGKVLVNGNGSTVLNVYYSRNEYSIRFELKNNNFTPPEGSHVHQEGVCYGVLTCHDPSCVKTLQCEREHTHSGECCSLEEHPAHDTSCCPQKEHTHDGTGCYRLTGASFGNRITDQETISTIEASNNISENKIVQTGSWNNYRYYFKIGTSWYQISGLNDYYWQWVTVTETDTEHTHGTGCQYEDQLHTHGDGNCLCEKEEHTHTDDCYGHTCSGNTTHTHDSSCYSTCARPQYQVTGSGSNRYYVITAKYEQTVGDIWPTASDFSGITFRGWEIETVSSDAVSKRVTMTDDLCNTKDADRTLEAKILKGGSKKTLYYMFESFDQSSPENGNDRILRNGVYYDSDPLYKQVVNTDSDRFGQKQITGMQAVNGGTETLGDNFFLYYKRLRYTLKFQSVDTVEKTVTQIMYDMPLNQLSDGGGRISAYEPPYPDTLEPNAYEFGGWYTTPECYPGSEVKWSTIKMPNADLTLYAKWRPVVHPVRVFLTEDLKNENSTYMMAFDIPHGELVPEDQRPADPVNGDYQFIGWFYRDSDGYERAFDFANMPVRDGLHLYAKWSSNVLKNYTIRYVTKDANGNEIEIASPTVGSALAGTTKTFEAKGGSSLYLEYREGYFPLTKSHSITLNIEQDGSAVYTFEYVQKEAVPYTVHYYQLDLDGNPVYETDKNGNRVNVRVHPSKTVSTKQSEVVENYVLVTGYRPDDFQKTLIISAETGADNTIIFWYRPNTTHAFLRVNHYLEDIPASAGAPTTWTPSQEYSYANEVLIVGNTVQRFSESPVNIEGFTYDAEVVGTKLEGTLSSVGQELELKLYYRRNKYPYEIRYLELGTNKVLADPVSGSSYMDYYGNAITASEADRKTIDGYNFYAATGCTIAVETNFDNIRKNIINVYYVPKTGNLQVTKRIQIINSNAPDPNGQIFEFILDLPDGVTGSYSVTIDGQKTMVTAIGGVLKFYLKDGQSALIEDLPQGPSTGKYRYAISETPVPGFESRFDPLDTFTISEDELTKITCINEYPVGNLKIIKTVDKEYPGDVWQSGRFSFTITSDALNRSGKEYMVSINGGEATKYTANNHTIVINDVEVIGTNTPVTIEIANVPAGSYTVTESDDSTLQAAYTTTANGVAGYDATVNVMPAETPAEATFVNTFKRTTGGLFVSKEIQIVPDSGAEIDQNTEFTFTVQLPEDVADYWKERAYTVTGHSSITSVTVGSDGQFTFTLKHGESLSVKGLPVGSYVIRESIREGYASSFQNVSPEGDTASENVEITTNTQTRLKCINTYPMYVGNLKITKTVQGQSGIGQDTAHTFRFLVEFTPKGGNLVFPTTHYDKNGQQTTVEPVVTKTASGQVQLTVWLKDGESVIIENLPAGECTVTEVEIPDSYTAVENNRKVTIVADHTQDITMVNRYELLDLTIQKTNAEEDQVFVYEVKDFKGNIITVTVVGNSSTTIHGLLPGTYTVTQKNLWSWRYGDEDEEKSVTLTDKDETVVFGSGVSDDHWLDGLSKLLVNLRGARS